MGSGGMVLGGRVSEREGDREANAKIWNVRNG